MFGKVGCLTSMTYLFNYGWPDTGYTVLEAVK